MSEPLQDFRHDQSHYQRPTQPWLCGWTRVGKPCRVGPSQRGVCRARYECKPLLKTAKGQPASGDAGDRWHCTRPRTAGGPCVTGPLPDGRCARRIPRCQPYRSLRARRGLVTRAAAAFTVGLILLVLGGPRLQGLRTATISPGPLSSDHAAITTCETCHAGAGQQVRALAGGAAGTTDQCVACHQPVGTNTVLAHSIDPATLGDASTRIRATASTPWRSLPLVMAALGPGAPFAPDEAIPCVTCHQEHRGHDTNIATLNSRRCQACHAGKFMDFARDHPPFSDYPAGRTQSDYFEHGAHEADIGALRCNDCHTVNADGAIAVRAYDATCADCHDDDMRDLTRAFTGLPDAPLERLTPFDHAPHLTRDCTACHQTGAASNFDPIAKSSCADCHARGRTSQTCSTCHAYHSEGFRLGRRQ